jgi:hypothetical protein
MYNPSFDDSMTKEAKMKKIILLAKVALPTLLVGCAASLTLIEAKNLSSYELCKNMYRTRYTDDGMMMAMQEIESRGESCDKWAGIMAQDGARRMAAYAVSQQASQALINNSRQKQCFTQMIGNAAQTNCN